MDKKVIIIAAVLLGGAACVYAVTEMDGESDELSATDPGDVVDPPTVPPVNVDAGAPSNIQAPPEPEGALDPIIQELLASGVLTRSVSCGGNACEAGELCCVSTGECIPSSCTDCCESPEREVPTPPLEQGIDPPPEPQ
jgi:hypothetical protein